MMPVVALFPLTDVRQGGKKEVKKKEYSIKKCKCCLHDNEQESMQVV